MLVHFNEGGGFVKLSIKMVLKELSVELTTFSKFNESLLSIFRYTDQSILEYHWMFDIISMSQFVSLPFQWPKKISS